MLKKSASGVLAGHRRLTIGVHKRGALYPARREPQKLNMPPGESCSSSLGRAGEKGYASPLRRRTLMGHGPLTISLASRRSRGRASTDVPCLIRHGVNLADLAAALQDSLF